MHLRNRLLSRLSTSSPLDNKALPMANINQAPDLEGLHCEIHGMAEQMRIMNKNNSRLLQHLVAANLHLQLRFPFRILGDLTALIARATILIIVVMGEIEIGSIAHQVPDQGAKEARYCQNPDHPMDLLKLMAKLEEQTERLFTRRVIRAKVSSKFKLPSQLEAYKGKIDLMDHLDSYRNLIVLQGYSDEVMCKAFLVTLKGSARTWFRKLPPRIIDSFGEISRLFVTNFMTCRAVLEVEGANNKVIVMAMMEGLRPGPLLDSLSRNVPETQSALQSKANKYIATKELAEAKRRRRTYRDHRRPNDRRPHTPPRRLDLVLPHLNAPIAQVLIEIKHEKFVKWPTKIKTDPRNRDRSKLCDFHQDHGHNIEDCFQLKKLVVDLIKKGYLRKYIADHRPLS
ncbi:hypothetical protein Acr_05g0016060 [Actinidia rufa]|uniref:Retrotransposon gag domain-containing protein n=1 Tax=Actinidia rufa TaxID=165716 RepID=A0A7J0EQW2_9ERIC|nr:hypothetical protein Acr_05g0016060 [Actinidia rufa]